MYTVPLTGTESVTAPFVGEISVASRPVTGSENVAVTGIGDVLVEAGAIEVRVTVGVCASNTKE